MVPIMLQRWHEISFLHWSCDGSDVAPHLPPGIIPDLYEGKAWISLTPFLLRGLRSPLLPKWLGMDFPEMNLRTYVIGREGPGIWFFSLDAGKLSPVLGARAAYGLPYYLAKMTIQVGKRANIYTVRRNRTVRARIEVLKGPPIATPSALDVFLTARFRLYSTWARRLITAKVEHPPWQLQHAEISDLEENVRAASRVAFPSGDFLVHHSIGVDTKIGLPRLA